MDPAIEDVVLRPMQALHDSVVLAILGVGILRELHYRVLVGPQGGAMVSVLRLHEARLLIARRDKTIAEVAASVGYASSAQFNRDFKWHFRRTASEEVKWFRQHLGELP